MPNPQIRRIMRDLSRLIERETAGLAGDVVERLEAATPRDTGRAAASWRPSIGAPVDPIEPQASPQAAKMKQLVARAAVQGYRLEFGSIHITNHSGYAAELDAERPFIDDAIDQAIAARQGRRVRLR